MKRKKTVILVSSLLALVLAAGSAYVGYRLLLKRRVLTWREQGIAAARAGDHEKAAGLLLRYVQRYPRDVEALGYYAKSRELAELPNGQHIAETIAALRLLVQFDPANLDNRRHLAELYARSERWPEALDTANAILGTDAPATGPAAGNVSKGSQNVAKHPDDLPTLKLKVQALSGLRRYREALDTAERWTRLAPSDVQGHIARLAMRAQLGQDPELVVADAAELAKAHPDDPGFQLLQGFAHAQAYSVYSQKQGDPQATALADQAMKGAASCLRKAAAHPGLKEEFIKMLVSQLDGLGMSDDSTVLLQKQEQARASHDLRHLLLRRLWEAGRWQETIDAAADVDPSDANADPTLLAMKAMALARAGKGPESTACRSALASRKQPAARAWSALFPRLIDGAATDDQKVIAECRSTLQFDPRNSYLACYLGQAYARMGEADIAIGYWRQSVLANPNWREPAIELVDALIQRGRPEVAYEVAVSLWKRNPRSAAALVSVARAWAAGLESGSLGNDAQLLDILTKVQDQLPDEDQTRVIRIELLSRKGDKEQASRLAREALGRTPPMDERMLLALARVSRQFGLGVEGECLSRCEQVHGRTPALAYAKAAEQFQSGHGPDGLKLIDDWAARSGKANDLAWQLARAHYLDLNPNPDAVAVYSALGDAHINDASVQQAILSAACVNAAAGRGDWTPMERAIERLRLITGEKGLAWRMAKARMMVEFPRKDADADEGSVLLNDILREYPQIPEAHVMLGDALLRMRRTDGAVEHYAKAASLQPNNTALALQLASLLKTRGETDRARQELERIAPRLRTSAERERAAELLAQLGQFDRALGLLEHPSASATTAPSGDRKAELLRAMLYANRREFDKAGGIVGKLLQMPDLPAVQFAASFYALQGRPADAEKALGLLKSLKLEPGTEELAWADYYSRAQDYARAAENYRKATDQAPDKPGVWQALAGCQMFLGKSEEAVATIDEAARALPADKSVAVLKANSALLREAAADQAMRPLALLIVRDPLNSDQAMELVRIVAEGRRSKDMVRLAATLQQFVDRNQSFLPARGQLVDCLWAMGRKDDALNAARQTMNAFPADPDAARLATRLYDTAGRWDEMQAAAQVWKTRAGQDSAPDVAIARADIGMRRYEAAEEQLRSYLPAAKAEPERYPELLTTYGVAAVNNGHADAAAELLWPLVQTAPAWRVRWEQVAMEAPDVKLARQWLDRLSVTMTDDALMERVGMAEAYERCGSRFGDKDARGRATALFKQIAGNPKTTAVPLLAAATYMERQGDFGTAETFYRQSLTKDPNNWIALNNLAVLIVRRGEDVKEAITLASAAVKDQPTLANVHETLAQAQAKAGRPKDAVECMRTAIKLEPGNIVWRVRLAQYLISAGDTTGANNVIAAIDAERLDVRDLAPAAQQDVRAQLDEVRKQLKGKRG